MLNKNQALLTGSGFSCNMGGLSGGDFLIRLSNNETIQRNDRIAGLLGAEDADYESIYRTVIENGGFEEDDKKIVIAAYDDAYLKLDRSICLECYRPGQPLNLNNLSMFLDCFAGDLTTKERGYIFTLNQDLFVERGYFGGINLGVPGIVDWRIRPSWVSLMDWSRLGHDPLPIRVIPCQEEVKRIKENDRLGRQVPQKLQYVKLHGSMNWRTKEGSRVMVIAGRKIEQIQSVPLLKWYFEKFSEALATPNMHLCVIGYGFGDPHVNRALADAIDNNTLVRISIVHPRKTRAKLEDQIREKNKVLPSGDEITALILQAFGNGKLFDFDLQKAFSHNGPITDTDAGRRLLDTFGPK